MIPASRRPRAPPLAALAVCALVCGTARAADPPAAPAGTELPDALPPLDDSLVEGPSSPFTFFGQARVRGELDDSRDLARADDSRVGTAVTARVGADAELDSARLIVVLGDGGRLGQPASAPPLVPRPALPELYEAELAFDLSLFGVPASLAVGRMPVVVADGRWVGVEPFDPRGRTLDGARVRAHSAWAGGDGLDAGLGAYWLGPGTADATDASGAISGLFVVDAAARPQDDVELDVYGLLHRDGPGAITVPTSGVRLSGRFGAVTGRAGADVQAPLVDAASANLLSPTGVSAHAEASLRGALSSFYATLGGELTAGDAVAGRVFRAPAPTQHGALGLLDFVAADNTWVGALGAGVQGDRGLLLDVTGRVIGIVDRNGPLLDTAFQPVVQRRGNGVALFELDARAEIPLSDDVSLGVGYAVALPGQALVGDQPAQRLLVELRAGAASHKDAHAIPQLAGL